MKSQFDRSAASRSSAATAALFWAALSGPAVAQMQLPGAFTPAPAGTISTPAPAAGAVKKPVAKKPVASGPKVPADDGVIGRPLLQNGRAGVLEFNRAGKDLQIARLKLAGAQIGRPSEACEIDLSGSPVALSAAGRPAGVTRYAVNLPACPFSVDILEGAVQVVSDGKACEFKAADCRVDPAGLWGQPASEIGPQRTKDIEAQRRQAEQTMRANFKAWLSSVGGDQAMVSRIAREQAAFSSKREELCRTYARESQHGYCALVATEARATAIAAHILPQAPADEDEVATARKAKKR